MKVLGLCASLRKGSLNRKLLHVAEQALPTEGIHYNYIDLSSFQLPYYDGDLETSKGIPALAEQLALEIVNTDALIIASPEYNFSIPGHFKNTFDWISRKRPVPFHKKHTLIMTASPSMTGGNRSAWALRVPFEAVGAYVYPDMFSLAIAHEAFDGEKLKDSKMAERLHGLVNDFILFARARI